jgi:LPS export ABC transporter protein LptC
MQRLLKHWPLAGIGILVLVVLAYLIGGGMDSTQEFAPSGLPGEQGLKLENIHYTQDDPDEKVKWSLHAKEVRFSQDRQLLSFSDFHVVLEPEGRPRIQLTGRHGDYDKNSGRMDLRGDLQGHTNDGYTILTEHMFYDRNAGFIKTEEPVQIMGPSVSVSGEGLYLDLEMGTLRILSRVETTIDHRFLGL